MRVVMSPSEAELSLGSDFQPLLRRVEPCHTALTVTPVPAHDFGQLHY